MIQSTEYLGGADSVALVGDETYYLDLSKRWVYAFVSGFPVAVTTLRLPVSENLVLGTEFTVAIETGTTNWVQFTNGKGAIIDIFDKDGVVRTNVQTSSGEFGYTPMVRARLISPSNGGVWTIYSVGDGSQLV